MPGNGKAMRTSLGEQTTECSGRCVYLQEVTSFGPNIEWTREGALLDYGRVDFYQFKLQYAAIGLAQVAPPSSCS
jgi:hypothetical protein